MANVSKIKIPSGIECNFIDSTNTVEESGVGYIRYSNGIQICYGEFKIEYTASDVSAWGNMFVVSKTLNRDFPKPFLTGTYPKVTVTASSDSSGVIINCQSNNEKIIKVPLMRQNANGSYCYVQYIAIGTWK